MMTISDLVNAIHRHQYIAHGLSRLQTPTDEDKKQLYLHRARIIELNNELKALSIKEGL